MTRYFSDKHRGLAEIVEVRSPTALEEVFMGVIVLFLFECCFF